MDQKEKSEATRAALIAAARKLFSERGYHAVGIREFAAAAGVTRGALYHHFGDKDSLFQAVFEAVQRDSTEAAARRHRDPGRPDRWTQLRDDLQRALDDATLPDVQRITLIDAPAVFGWTKWREIGGRHGLNAVRKGLEESMKAGFIREQPVLELAHLIMAAKDEAAMMIANAEDPVAKRSDAGRALEALLRGLE